MKLDLNHDAVKVSIDLWRKALDMQIPLAPDLRIHFFARRGELLDNFSKIARSWLMLLTHCKATGEDLIALDALEEEIEGFKAWAENGMSELAQLAAEELASNETVGGPSRLPPD